MNAARVTALHAVHAAAGASFTDFAGWWMPLRYGSEVQEHQAVRDAAGMFDLSHMGQISVIGPDAGRLLDSTFVSSLSGVAVGRAKYTMMCCAEGGVVDDVVIYRLAETDFLVVANAGNRAVVLSQMAAAAVGRQVEVADLGEAQSLIAVQGPASADIVAQVADLDIAQMAYYSMTPAVIAEANVSVARTGYTGEDGFEIYLPSCAAVDVWNGLREAGEQHGMVPAGLACRDTLRLEAGMPLYGHELDQKTSPYEAGLGRVVDLSTRGDFTGRAALERLAATKPQRVLVGIEMLGRRVPRQGHVVLNAEADEPVGWVTSGAPSPTLRHPIAMAYVDVFHADEGTSISVDVRGRSEPGRIVPLPFYRRRR